MKPHLDAPARAGLAIRVVFLLAAPAQLAGARKEIPPGSLSPSLGLPNGKTHAEPRDRTRTRGIRADGIARHVCRGRPQQGPAAGGADPPAIPGRAAAAGESGEIPGIKCHKIINLALFSKGEKGGPSVARGATSQTSYSIAQKNKPDTSPNRPSPIPAPRQPSPGARAVGNRRFLPWSSRDPSRQGRRASPSAAR
jgi:hypothetical protein